MSSILGRVCTPSDPLRVGVLVSGSGSNLQALLDLQPRTFAVVVVVANVVDAYALERARAAGVDAVTLPHVLPDRRLSRAEHEAQVQAVLDDKRVELLVLAGYMRVLTPWLVSRWKRRIVNVHPALLPAFPGLHGAKQALDHGCRVAGCTVHLVDEGVDTGPILMQAAVPVLDDDDEAALQKRIQAEEHRLLPRVVEAIATGRVVDDAQRPGLVRVRGL